jgi:hypothetical protein
MLTSPPGNDVVVIVSPAVTVIERACVTVADMLSIALTVKFAVPTPDGVPLIAPPGLSEQPAGNAPAEIDHVNGGVPPLAAKLYGYGAPTSPLGNDIVVIVGADATLIERATVTDARTLSATLRVKSAGPASVGVPLIWPPRLIDKPAGSAPAAIDHL